MIQIPHLREDEDHCQSVPIATLKKILLQALAWFYNYTQINDMSETAHIRLDQISFMVPTSSDLFNSIMFVPNTGRNIDE